MHKIVKIALATNLLMALFFVASNYTIWDFASSSSQLVKLVNFSPFSVAASFPGEWVNGQIIPVQCLPSAPIFNFPFWLFFGTLALNLFFIFELSRKPNTQ